jgi:NTP pyrophosphatase (non-canonical NTP hydrolase)
MGLAIETNLSRALEAILEERKRQNEKWGKQEHNPFVWFAILSEEVGELAEACLHDSFGGHAAGTLRAELVQVAAVAVQWLEAIEAATAVPRYLTLEEWEAERMKDPEFREFAERLEVGMQEFYKEVYKEVEGEKGNR